MFDFSLVTFIVFMVCVVQYSSSYSHETKTAKCLKSPDIWKKVDSAIKECQEEVKLKIIKDVLTNGDEWDDTFVDHDDHLPWVSDGHEHHERPIIDHYDIHDQHPPIHDHDHRSPIIEHNSPILDHHSLIHDHPSPIHNHHSPIHDHHPLHEHHSPIHDHHSAIHDHHSPIHEHHSPVHDDHIEIHDHNPHIHHPSPNGHHSSTSDQHSGKHFPFLHNDKTSIHHHRPSEIHPTHSHFASDFTLKHHHPHDSHQIEAPQLKFPHPFVLSSHQETPKKVHHSSEHIVEHVNHADSMGSLNPIEHNQHVDFNDFRKKRDASEHPWVHESTVSYHDKRIAGCIMQCIYEKNHATDKLGWPTLDGLVNFYSEGVNEHGYFMATLRAVDHCLKGSSAKYHVNRRSTPENGQTCDVAFDVFDCISDQITEYCSDHHT